MLAAVNPLARFYCLSELVGVRSGQMGRSPRQSAPLFPAGMN